MSENLIDVSQDLCSGDIKEKKASFTFSTVSILALLTLVSNL